MKGQVDCVCILKYWVVSVAVTVVRVYGEMYVLVHRVTREAQSLYRTNWRNQIAINCFMSWKVGGYGV